MPRNGASLARLWRCHCVPYRGHREMPNGKEIVAFSGEVAVGADDRVAKVTYKAVVSGARSAEIMTVMRFSHYGEPAAYEKP